MNDFKDPAHANEQIHFNCKLGKRLGFINKNCKKQYMIKVVNSSKYK